MSYCTLSLTVPTSLADIAGRLGYSVGDLLNVGENSNYGGIGTGYSLAVGNEISVPYDRSSNVCNIGTIQCPSNLAAPCAPNQTPIPSYETSAPSYGGPGSYATPSTSSYVPPNFSSNTQPSSIYAPPNYSSSTSNQVTPNYSSNTQPSSNYVPPNYPSNTSNYVPPSSNYVPPSSNYVPPSSNYVPPSSNQVTPNYSSNTQPSSNYVPPSSNYVPPSSNQVTPNYSSNTQPSSNYVPPNYSSNPSYTQPNAQPYTQPYTQPNAQSETPSACQGVISAVLDLVAARDRSGLNVSIGQASQNYANNRWIVRITDSKPRILTEISSRLSDLGVQPLTVVSPNNPTALIYDLTSIQKAFTGVSSFNQNIAPCIALANSQQIYG